MPHLPVHGADLYVEDSGGTGEPVLFLHGFLFDGRQYEAQVAALRTSHRCLTLDFRGQGRSSPTGSGYQVESQAADVRRVISELGLGPVHLVGLSMGGFVGLRLAARDGASLIRSLAVMNSSAAPHARSKFPKQLALAGVARTAGVDVPQVRAGVEQELFGDAWRTDAANEPVLETWRQRRAAGDRASLVATLLGFMMRADVRPELADISVPTLVIGGGADVSLPPTHSREMHGLIPDATYVELPGVGHSAPIEAPADVTTALRDHLDRASG